MAPKSYQKYEGLWDRFSPGDDKRLKTKEKCEKGGAKMVEYGVKDVR